MFDTFLKAFKTGLSTLLEYDVALFIRKTEVGFNAIKAIFPSLTQQQNKLVFDAGKQGDQIGQNFAIWATF